MGGVDQDRLVAAKRRPAADDGVAAFGELFDHLVGHARLDRDRAADARLASPVIR